LSRYRAILSLREEETMATWAEFEGAAPALAEAGRKLVYQHKVGLAFLATVRKDGGPRVHPFCPIIYEGGLYAFLLSNSYKRDDLLREPRFAAHAFPTDEDEEFYFDGIARPLPDAGLRAKLVAFTGGQLGSHDFEELWTFDIERVLHTTWHNRAKPDTYPTHQKWKA
jgi:hypothetical protein